MFKRYKFVALLVCLCVFSCSIVGTACADDVEFKVYAKQLILDGSLNMAFYVNVTKTEAEDTNTTKTATFTVGSKTGIEGKFDSTLTGYIGDNNQFVEGSVPNEEEHTTCYAFVVELTSVQMADSITGTIKVGDKQGTVESYNVQEYLNALTDNTKDTYNEKAAPLANALKDYGHYALTTLNETNAACASANHATITQSDNTLDDGTNATNAVAGYGIDKNGLTGLTFTLDLMSKTSLVVNLPEGASITDNVNITRTGAWKSEKSEEVTTWTWNETEQATLGDGNGGNGYIHDQTENTITFADISAHELFYKYNIPITLSGTNYTVTVSPMSYVKGALDLVGEVDKLNDSNGTVTDVMKKTLFTEAEQNNTTTVTVENAKKRATNLKNALIALYNYYTETCKYKGLTE